MDNAVTRTNLILDFLSTEENWGKYNYVVPRGPDAAYDHATFKAVQDRIHRETPVLPSEPKFCTMCLSGAIRYFGGPYKGLISRATWLATVLIHYKPLNMSPNWAAETILKKESMEMDDLVPPAQQFLQAQISSGYSEAHLVDFNDRPNVLHHSVVSVMEMTRTILIAFMDVIDPGTDGLGAEVFSAPMSPVRL